MRRNVTVRKAQIDNFIIPDMKQTLKPDKKLNDTPIE